MKARTKRRSPKAVLTVNTFNKFWRASSRRGWPRPLLAPVELLARDVSMDCDACGRVLDATQPSLAFHKRRVRSLDKVHTCGMSEGQACVAREMMSAALGSFECKRDVNDERKEPW